MARRLLVLFLMLANVSVAAQPRRRAARHHFPVASEAVVAAARQAAATAMTAGVPAVQIAISHRGAIVYSEAFGMTDKESATAATQRSVLRVGSITKQFTSAAILRLAERGALTLDDRIEKHVPEFDPRGAAITLRHLLSHTSGVVRDWSPPNAPVVPSVPVTRAQVIAGINAQPFLFTPGSKWNYSNAGYNLLGFAIESITGRPYIDFVYSELLLPLGLIETGMCGTSALPLPDGYGVFNGNWVRMGSYHTSRMASSGSFCSTASDLVRWAHLLATGHAMLPASYATMTNPVLLSNGSVVTNGYALGVAAQQIQGHPAVGHGGAVSGFQSFLLHLTEQDMAIAVIVNAFPIPVGGHPEVMTNAIAKAALATP